MAGESDRRIVIVNVIIHGFAIARAVTAATLSQTVIGDEAALTALTIAMIVGISRVYNRPWGVGNALAFLGCFAGFYLGTRGAVFLIKWIPGIGNAANAATAASWRLRASLTYFTAAGLLWSSSAFSKTKSMPFCTRGPIGIPSRNWQGRQPHLQPPT